MAKGKIEIISDELLAAFLDGNTTAEETQKVLCAMEQDEALKELLITSDCVDMITDTYKERYRLLPMNSLAAQGEKSLCDLQCEAFILNELNIGFDSDELLDEAYQNRWLKEKGTPLHNIGRLLEQNGCSVVRKYSATTKDLIDSIKNRDRVIAVVDPGKLVACCSESNDEPAFHAMVVLDYNENENSVIVYNPGSISQLEKYPIEVFSIAWKESFSYMVAVRIKSGFYDYLPQPIDLEDINLSDDLTELREAIAENAHDVWASARMREGWTYGPVRDDNKKQNPDLIPYADLPDSEKQYDRDMAMNTIKLVKKLGYELIKHPNNQSSNLLINRLKHADDQYLCKNCNSIIFKGQVFCEHCGEKINYLDFL